MYSRAADAVNRGTWVQHICPLTTSVILCLQTDPEAAKLVFESGVHLTMIPLEVGHPGHTCMRVYACASSPGYCRARRMYVTAKCATSGGLSVHNTYDVINCYLRALRCMYEVLRWCCILPTERHDSCLG